MLKAISFDFWQTLYTNTSNRDERQRYIHTTVQRILSNAGISIDLECLSEAFLQADNEGKRLWKEEHRTLTNQERILLVESALAINIPSTITNRLADVLNSALLYYRPHALPNAKKTLRVLNRRYQLALVSDTNYSPGSTIKAFLKEEGLFDFFGPLIFSDEVGYAKPSSQIFESLLSALGAKPQEVIYVGDSEEVDILGAIKAGLIAIRCDVLNPKRASQTLGAGIFREFSELPGLISSLETDIARKYRFKEIPR
jgi:putative hydrolase of the HAD superfamily